MRILHLVTAFPRDERDIIAPWLVELIKRQRAAGHDAQVFTAAYHGSGDHLFAGIPVHRFRYFFARWEALTHDESAADRMQRSLLYRLMPAPFVVAGMFAAWRLCRRERFDARVCRAGTSSRGRWAGSGRVHGVTEGGRRGRAQSRAPAIAGSRAAFRRH